jgi:LysM repeat protein
VWGWALASLGLAYAFSRYKAGKSAAQTPTTTAAAQPGTGAPYYVIENNMPPINGGPSTPVINTQPPPVTTPPGTGAKPPINGGKPPVQVGSPTPVKGPAPKPTPAPVSSKPTYQKHIVVQGDSYSKIASEYHVPNQGSTPAWEVLYNYNIGPSSPHSDQARAELQKQGQNTIYPGQIIYIPA